MKKQPTITINDVARHCGISKSTVSRALNRPEMVSGEMREKVLKAVAELNYIPNPVARALNFGEISVVALVAPSAQVYLQSELIIGCRAYLQRHGISLLVLDNILYNDRTMEYQKVLKQLICNGIVFCFENDERFILEMASRVPVVSFELRSANGRFSCVQTDVEMTVRMCLEHLCEKGHERLGMVLGRKGDAMTRRYEAAYTHHIKALGLTPDESLIRRYGWSYEAGYRSVEDLMRLPEPPSALFIVNGNMGLGALTALKNMGLRVPEDVSIVCGNGPTSNRYLHFPLDCLVQPIHRAGERLAEMLVDQISGIAGTQYTLYQPTAVAEAGSVIPRKP